MGRQRYPRLSEAVMSDERKQAKQDREEQAEAMRRGLTGTRIGRVRRALEVVGYTVATLEPKEEKP